MSFMNTSAPPLREGLRELIYHHGFWAVVRTTFVLRQEKRLVRGSVDHLSPHLRQDIGLPHDPSGPDPHLWRFRA